MKPRPAKPSSIIAQVEGSGIVGETATPRGVLNPEISEAFTVAPEVVYSPIVPLPEFATNRSDPETAMPSGKLNPGIQRGVHRRARSSVFANRAVK